MATTTIEWTATYNPDGSVTPGKTWNPIRVRRKDNGKVGWACTKPSEGCKNCYAEKINLRLGTGLPYTIPALDQVEFFLDEKTLMLPLRWKGPRKIFPCSMTDWAADFVTDEMMDRMLAVAALTPWHTYQFLTKRAERLARWGNGHPKTRIEDAASIISGKQVRLTSRWPLRNLHFGFSAEDQPNFDARWEHMRKLAVAGWFTWVSLEPLLGPIDAREALESRLLRWGVVGGESGAGARVCQIEWVGESIEQFSGYEVPLFVKQAGSNFVTGLPAGGKLLGNVALSGTGHLAAGWKVRLKDRKGGDMSEWPEWMRVRQMP